MNVRWVWKKAQMREHPESGEQAGSALCLTVVRLISSLELTKVQNNVNIVAPMFPLALATRKREPPPVAQTTATDEKTKPDAIVSITLTQKTGRELMKSSPAPGRQ